MTETGGDETRLETGASNLAARATRLQTGDAFGTRYQILKELGAGGMGVVYQAWDQTLNVVVALKVIRRDADLDEKTRIDVERRFKRELLLARQVTHKNVVRIHDLGDVDGTKYITMSYVEGDDLSTVLRRDGKLPIEQVISIAKQIASGLQAAHEAGVVHRDLKPANIMIDRATGQAQIMDFGIAQPASAPAPSASGASAGKPAPGGAVPTGDETVLAASQTTMAAATSLRSGISGAVVGTLEYMSPEQSKGQPVDHRTDIYAFGLILTDLLLGPRVRPEGATPWQALTSRIAKAPEPLAKRMPEVPEPFDAIITKCLQLNPDDRYATTAELVAALDRLDPTGQLIPEPKRWTRTTIAIAATVVIAAVGGTYWLTMRARPTGPHAPVSVLIADFTNSTNDPVFSGLVEQALAVGVEGASFVSAFPHRDAMRVVSEIKAGPALDDAAARLVAMREGLDVTIGGGIASRGSGYTVSVKATNVGDQKVLLDWSTNAAKKEDVLDAVGRAAERVRRTLGDTSSGSKTSAEETFTAASLEAAKAYSEGQELQWEGKFEEALARFQQAVTLDPQFGRAHAGMAALYANLGRTEEAEASYLVALKQLDRMTEREKLRTRGGYALFKRNYDKAIEEFDTLVKQYPADTSGLANLALADFYKRDMKSALEVGKRASDIYPNNVIRKNNAALFAMYAGNFDEAVQLASKVLELNPSFAKAYVALGVSQLALDKSADAAATWDKLDAIGTAAAKSFAATGRIDLALYEGRNADALKLLADAIAVDRAAKNSSSLGRRLALRAGILAAQKDRAGALRDAKEAATLGKDESILYFSGRAMIDAGQPALAKPLADTLDNRLENEPRIYGALLRGEMALAAGKARDALTAFEEALKLGDAWLARESEARAYLALGALPEASAEFDRCLSRRGEASAVFLDDLPSYHLLRVVTDESRRLSQR